MALDEVLRRLNRVKPADEALAKLVRVIEGFDLNDADLFPEHCMYLRFRPDQWDQVAQARNDLERVRGTLKGQDKQATEEETALLAAIKVVNLTRCWSPREQRVHVPTAQWADILATAERCRRTPNIAVALATAEYVAKHA